MVTPSHEPIHCILDCRLGEIEKLRETRKVDAKPPRCAGGPAGANGTPGSHAVIKFSGIKELECPKLPS